MGFVEFWQFQVLMSLEVRLLSLLLENSGVHACRYTWK